MLSILIQTIQRIVADPKRKLSPPFDSADSVPSLGHPASGKCCRYLLCFAITQSGWPRPEPRVRVKRFSQSECSSTRAAVARTTFRLDRFRNHSRSAFSCVKREFSVYTLLARYQRQVLRYYVIGLGMSYIWHKLPPKHSPDKRARVYSPYVLCCIHASCTVSTSSAKVLCNMPSYAIYLT